jgi:hypothetical protein
MACDRDVNGSARRLDEIEPRSSALRLVVEGACSSSV